MCFYRISHEIICWYWFILLFLHVLFVYRREINNLDKFRDQQKMIEEANKQRKALLSKTLTERWLWLTKLNYMYLFPLWHCLSWNWCTSIYPHRFQCNLKLTLHQNLNKNKSFRKSIVKTKSYSLEMDSLRNEKEIFTI